MNILAKEIPSAGGTGTRPHPRAWEPATLIVILLVSAVGAIIGLQILTTLGMTPNTSIIGALVAMIIARIPNRLFISFRSTHVQNLVQSAMSTATFGAANGLLLPIGIPYVLNRPDLILPMFAGVSLAMILDGYLLYRMYGSALFPANAAWPQGIAAAEAIRAGDKGGQNAVVLGAGAAIGATGAWFGIPMSAFGTAFIGNVWALGMFGIGLLISGYSTFLFAAPVFHGIFPDASPMKALAPHGLMVGAGLVALLQMGFVMLARKQPAAAATKATEPEVRPSTTRRILGFGSIAYVLIAILLAVTGGLMEEMSLTGLVGFIVFAAAAALVHELIVGISAMHTGWFPAFAVALITLLLGILLGLPLTGLILLTGFSAATGPAFADMGYDLKTGTILRAGEGHAFDLDGRRQQWFASLIAFGVAIVVVAFSWESLFGMGRIPPINFVYASAIEAGVTGDAARNLFLWAIPGALLQFIGGSKRQMGVLFATGMLLGNVAAGFAVLIGIAVRLALTTFWPGRFDSRIPVFAGGVIAGDALFSFTNATIRSFGADK